MPKILALALPLLLLAACGKPAGDASGGPTGLRVVATTGMVADAGRAILGDLGTVESLMGPGVDPHLYKASESDVRRLAGADLILINGLHLEGKMGEILEKLATSRPVVAVGSAVPVSELREPAGLPGQHDPHLWFDVRLWSKTLEPITQALTQLLPAEAEALRARAERYRQELTALDAWVETRIAEIPAEQRVLVTAHDAFGYFGRRYGINVVGLQGISTLAEAGLSDVDRIVELVVSRKVKAIFVESSVPRRSIEAVQNACRARGHEVVIGGQLYSDALGAAGTPAGSYVGMVRANVETIVGALK